MQWIIQCDAQLRICLRASGGLGVGWSAILLRRNAANRENK